MKYSRYRRQKGPIMSKDYSPEETNLMIIEAADECRNILEEAEAGIAKLKAIYNRINEIMEHKEGDSFSSKEELNDVLGTLEILDLFDCFETIKRIYAEKLIKESSIPLVQEMSEFFGKLGRHVFYDTGVKHDMVAAFIEDSAIYIRTPLLPTKYQSKSGNPMAVKHSQAYADEVSAAIEKNYRYKYFSREKFANKTIFFLFAIEAGSRFIDNDNYDTTAVTNSIASHLYGGDSPLSCRMIYDSVLAEDIKPGTYITVLPGKTAVADVNDVIKFWENNTEK